MCHLTLVGFAKADDANAIRYFDKHQGMQAITDITQGPKTDFVVITAVIDCEDSCFEIKFGHLVKRQIPFAFVSFAFRRVEFDSHIYIVCTFMCLEQA